MMTNMDLKPEHIHNIFNMQQQIHILHNLDD